MASPPMAAGARRGCLWSKTWRSTMATPALTARARRPAVGGSFSGRCMNQSMFCMNDEPLESLVQHTQWHLDDWTTPAARHALHDQPLQRDRCGVAELRAQHDAAAGRRRPGQPRVVERSSHSDTGTPLSISFISESTYEIY
jgi:hypothetical protein